MAQSNSIVAFQRGVQGAYALEHVAWVTSVSEHADGLYLKFIEMNGARLLVLGHPVAQRAKVLRFQAVQPTARLRPAPDESHLTEHPQVL
jgi:hypothetical protein